MKWTVFDVEIRWLELRDGYPDNVQKPKKKQEQKERTILIIGKRETQEKLENIVTSKFQVLLE